jgi:hypothetical protein
MRLMMKTWYEAEFLFGLDVNLDRLEQLLGERGGVALRPNDHETESHVGCAPAELRQEMQAVGGATHPRGSDGCPMLPAVTSDVATRAVPVPARR